MLKNNHGICKRALISIIIVVLLSLPVQDVAFSDTETYSS